MAITTATMVHTMCVSNRKQHDDDIVDEDDESTMREVLYRERGNSVDNLENNGELVISESCQITDAAVIRQADKKPR